MYDRETESLWSQVDGKAFRGAREGKVLEHIPSTQTTWRNWKKMHPDALVLRKEEEFTDSHYKDYFADPEKLGMFGTHIEDARLGGKEMVAGVNSGDFQIAFPLSELPRGKVLNSGSGNQAIVLLPGKKGDIRAFSRNGPEGVLTFSKVVRKKGERFFLDRETSSWWNAETGEAVEGKLKGEKLTGLPVTETYWFAWLAFFPGTELWNGEEAESASG